MPERPQLLGAGWANSWPLPRGPECSRGESPALCSADADDSHTRLRLQKYGIYVFIHCIFVLGTMPSPQLKTSGLLNTALDL